jgi:hypothetical protein
MLRAHMQVLHAAMHMLQVALEEGVWDALVESVRQTSDQSVLEAVHAALAQLMVPGPEGESAAYPYLRKLAEAVLVRR